MIKGKLESCFADCAFPVEDVFPINNLAFFIVYPPIGKHLCSINDLFNSVKQPSYRQADHHHRPNAQGHLLVVQQS